MASSSQSLDFSFDALRVFRVRAGLVIAQTKPESSRAIAAVITVFNFPAWVSLR